MLPYLTNIPDAPSEDASIGSRKHQHPWGQSSRHRRSNVHTPTPNACSTFRRRTVSPFDPTDFEGSLKDRHGRCIEEEGFAAAARAAASLGVGEPNPDAEVSPALHWQPHLAAIDAGLGMELAMRLRASELAQAAFFAEDGAGERERIVQLHTLEQERGDWIRWAGAGDRLHDLAEGFGGGLSTGTAARLEPVLALCAGTRRSGAERAPRRDRTHDRVHGAPTGVGSLAPE